MWCANDNRGSPDAHWRLSSGESISPIHFLHLIIKHIIIHKNVTPLQEIKTKSGQFVFVLLLDSWWVLKVTCLDANRGVTYIILQECNKYNCQKGTQINLIQRTIRKNISITFLCQGLSCRLKVKLKRQNFTWRQDFHNTPR